MALDGLVWEVSRRPDDLVYTVVLDQRIYIFYTLHLEA
jgi:hypothetical protein